MTRTRLELLQWYALFGGAAAWAASHLVGYFLAVGGCDAAVAYWHLNISLWETLVQVLSLAGVLAAEAAAFAVFRATESVGKDAPGPAGRLHFFAQAALLGNVLFFMLVLLDTTGVLLHTNCRIA